MTTKKHPKKKPVHFFKKPRPSLGTMWMQGLIHGMVGLYLFLPALIFILLYLEAFKTMTSPITIILFIFTTIGLLIVFPIIQSFWVEMVKDGFKDKELIDLRYKAYRKKKSVILKI